MKNSLLLTSVLAAGVATAFLGCGRKADAKSELDKAQHTLSKADPAQPPVAQPTTGSTPAAAPAEQMAAAMAAYKAGNLEDAVTRLQKLRATPVMTPEQRIAVNDAMAAVMGEVYASATKGDARAIQAVKQYEQMQTQRR